MRFLLVEDNAQLAAAVLDRLSLDGHVVDHAGDIAELGISRLGDLSEMDRHIARIQEFKDAGLDELALRLHDDPAAAIRSIGEHIVPALK